MPSRTRMEMCLGVQERTGMDVRVLSQSPTPAVPHLLPGRTSGSSAVAIGTGRSRRAWSSPATLLPWLTTLAPTATSSRRSSDQNPAGTKPIDQQLDNPESGMSALAALDVSGVRSSLHRRRADAGQNSHLAGPQRLADARAAGQRRDAEAHGLGSARRDDNRSVQRPAATRQEDPRGWLVYSVGPNFQDDGGKVDDPVHGDVGVGPPSPPAKPAGK